MTKTNEQIASDLKDILSSSYPHIEVRVEPFELEPTRTAIFFSEPTFALIYPQQRYHYLSHLIPTQYQEQYLQEMSWFELAPGENPEDLVYLDEELIRSITPDVMLCLRQTRFFEALDDKLFPGDSSRAMELCYRDYRVSKSILSAHGFSEEEHFDLFHVLMAQGGYCDCEILFNVAEESRLKADYWKARAAGLDPYDPHRGTLTTD